VDWRGRPLPEVVQLTANREDWRRVVRASTANKGHELKGHSGAELHIFFGPF